MKRRLVAGLALLVVLSAAQAMEVEVCGQAVLMSGPVTGIELRVLESTLDSHPDINTVVLKNSYGGDVRAGYAVGEYRQQYGLRPVISLDKPCHGATLGVELQTS